MKKTAPFALCALLATAHPALAQKQDEAAFSEALSRDAAAYAQQFNVGLEEAQKRLALQHEVGSLDELLTREAEDTFGGLWIDHEPKFSVTVLSTDARFMRRFFSRNLEGDLASVIAVKPATETLTELTAQQEEVRLFLEASGIQADLDLDVRERAVVIETTNPSRLSAEFAERRFTPPASIKIVRVSSLTAPTDDIRGGRPITRCTAGFAVKTSNRRLGIATAGHCPNSSEYEDSESDLRLEAEHYSGSRDLQWHSATCDDTVRNEIFDGSGFRPITGVVGRGSQSIGTFVCKYGMTTDFTCGIIISRKHRPSYVPNARNTFIRVAGNNISEGGDSGGPWFVGNNAYGIHSGGNSEGSKATYTAADYLASAGYAVLTSPGNMTPWAQLNCTVSSTRFGCTAAGQSGITPYTFSDWQYWGPAGSWSGSGSQITGSFAYPGCRSGQLNSVLVRVTDSCGRSTFASANFNCPDSGSGCNGGFLCEDDPSFGN
ncbi:MAG: S1 family peptidase [Acidobacteriota bacterium]